MITLRNNSKYLDVRVFSILEDKQIDFSSSLPLTQELAKYAAINGFFDVIKETFLAIFVMDNSIKIIVGNIQTKADSDC